FYDRFELLKPHTENEQFCDVGRGITLCYETFGDSGDPPAFLIMGLATQMIGWNEDFCAGLAERGFYVIRFDNRDVGRSTHMPYRAPGNLQFLTKKFDEDLYTLADMAEDTARLIERLGLSPAHIIGTSMGGMIAQELAVNHPEIVRSLTSIMSSTGSSRHGQPSAAMYKHLLSRAPHNREQFIERAVEVFGSVGSPGFEVDPDWIRDRAARSYDRGYDVTSSARQLGAVLKSGNRIESLSRIQAPTLVIHGDSDPLIDVSGGRATAEAIPDAELLVVEGMGHDFPRDAWPLILDRIAAHAHAADRSRETVAGKPN
ncbi:MAG: alpha/beta fold hydrolase, partial [Myxococcota bacterium]